MADNKLLSTRWHIHRQNLASKKWHLNLMKSCFNLLKLLIILKNIASNTRQLKALCDEMGSDRQNLLFHSEVRWLSRGEVLKSLYEFCVYWTVHHLDS